MTRRACAALLIEMGPRSRTLPQQLQRGHNLLRAPAPDVVRQHGNGLPQAPAHGRQRSHAGECPIQFADVDPAFAEEALIPAQQRCACGPYRCEVDDLALLTCSHALLRVQARIRR
jgi:hypothetical protein